MENEKMPENGTGVALSNSQQPHNIVPVSQGANINYGNVFSHDIEDTDAIIDAMSTAEAAPLDATMSIWSASEMGETRTLMFVGYQMLDVEHDGKRSRIPYVIFAEVFTPKGAKKPIIRMIMVGRTKVTHFFLQIDPATKQVLGAKHPLQSIWVIGYQGIKVSKNKNLHDYSISPAVIQR